MAPVRAKLTAATWPGSTGRGTGARQRSRDPENDDWKVFYGWEKDHVRTGRVKKAQKLEERWKSMDEDKRKSYAKNIRDLKQWQGFIQNWNDRIEKAETENADFAKRHRFETQKRVTLERLEWRLKEFQKLQPKPSAEQGRTKPTYVDDLRCKFQKEIAAIFEARASGRVRCNGHNEFWRDEEGETVDGKRKQDRDELEGAWEQYYKQFLEHKFLAYWVVLAAMQRAVIVFEHGGAAVYPPKIGKDSADQDTENIVEVLGKVLEEEQRTYKPLPIYWESIQSTVQIYLTENGEQAAQDTEDVPLVDFAFKDEGEEETPNFVKPSAKALKHMWEADIRDLVEERANSKDVAEWLYYYQLALRQFYSADRKWRPKWEDFEELAGNQDGGGGMDESGQGG